MVTKTNVILFLFVGMALAYLIWLIFNLMKSKFCLEHFTDSESNSDSSYESRMNVMKVFDTVLHRKPTNEEIEKYHTVQNEQDLLVAVLADFNVLSDKIGEEFVQSDTKALVVKEETNSKQKDDIIEQLDNIVSAVSKIKKLLV